MVGVTSGNNHVVPPHQLDFNPDLDRNRSVAWWVPVAGSCREVWWVAFRSPWSRCRKGC